MTRLRDERGVSAVIVAVSLIAMMSALVLSLDAGNLWQTRRHLITGTDAAALEAARLAAINGPDDACDNYIETLNKNAGSEVTPIDCKIVADATGDTGYVVIEATKTAHVRFGGVLGLMDQQPYSKSAARWGFITAIEGLRPIGICWLNPHVQSYLQNQPLLDIGDHPASGIHRIYYNKEQPDLCGTTAPGNWGFLDLDGGANSNADLVAWLRNGYPGVVGTDDCDANGTPGDGCEGDTGSSGGSTDQALQFLVDQTNDGGGEFPIVIFNSVTGTGANVEYNVFAFLGVKLHGFLVTGAEEDRYFDFEFVKLTRPGRCCELTGVDTGVKGMRLCTVDHNKDSDITACAS